MSSGQKVAVSLLISVVIFSAIAVAAFAGLFSFVEARFYQPLVVKTIEQRLETVAAKQNEYSDTLSQRFSAFVADKNVASYALVQPTAEQQKARTATTGALLAETPSLRGIRLIDTNGRNVHFSTFESDIKLRSRTQISYKNYAEIQTVPFVLLSCADKRGRDDTSKILFDQATNLILYAFPFYDTYAMYRGTIVFYCDGDDFNRFLLTQGVGALSDTGTLTASPLVAEATSLLHGYVFGLPAVGRDVLQSAVLEKLAQPSYEGFATIVTTETGNWVVFSQQTANGSFIARVTGDDVLLFSTAVRVLLLAILFTTLFLIIFLLFNIKHDDMVVIKDRIRRFQLAFITEYMHEQADGELKALPADIVNRKSSLNTDIKRSLGRRAKKHEKEVDELLEHNWTEILGALGAKPAPAIAAPTTDTAELKRMLEEVLSSGTVHVQATSIAPSSPATPSAAPAQRSPAPQTTVDAVEEIAAAEPVDEVEEIAAAELIADVEEITAAEPVDEVEEIAAAEPIDDVEEIAAAELIDDVEEIATAELVDVVEEIAAAELVDEVEEIAAAEPIDDVEEIAAAEPVDDVEEIAAAELIDHVEEIAAAESVDDVEEIDAIAELVDEVEEIVAAEPIDDVEEIAAAELIDDVEEIATAELVDDVEEIAAAELVDEVEEIAAGEPIDDAEEIDAIAELVDEVEEIAAAEPIDDVEEIAAAEPVDDVEEIAAIAEPVEEVEEIAAEQVEDVEEIAAAEPIDEVEAVPLAPQAMAVSAFITQMRKPQNIQFVDLQDIVTAPPIRQSLDGDFTETIGFSSPTVIHGLNTDFIADTFKVEAPDFSALDELPLEPDDEDIVLPDEAVVHPSFVPLSVEESLQQKSQEHAMNSETESVEEIPVLEESDAKSVFSFTSFGRNDTPVTELLPDEPEDAIVESADGTYHISETLPLNTQPLDTRFKALVDSVLG